MPLGPTDDRRASPANGARLPTRPEEVRTGREMDFPYPSRALASQLPDARGGPGCLGAAASSCAWA